MFHVPIGNENNTEMNAFDSNAPEIKYVQDANNNCVLSSMASALFAANEHVADYAVL